MFRIDNEKGIKHKPKSGQKGAKSGHELYYVKGKPVLESHCMIYWFWWGDVYFDIRSLRKESSKFSKSTYKADTRFSCSRIWHIAKHVARAAEAENFEEIIQKLHCDL